MKITSPDFPQSTIGGSPCPALGNQELHPNISLKLGQKFILRFLSYNTARDDSFP